VRGVLSIGNPYRGWNDRKNLSIENPYRLKTGKNRLKKGWESKLGVVSLYWGRLLGGGTTPQKTSYKKLGYVKDCSYIPILP